MEIEARVSKQIHGAVLDLMLHHCDKKLLIIMPVHTNNPSVTAIQCENILARYICPENFRVVITQGSGDVEKTSEDVLIIRTALRELGFKANL